MWLTTTKPVMADEALVPEHYRNIFRFVRRRVRSVEDAEDVTQEVFLDAAAALGRSATETPPTLAWLYTVARRRIVDESRRRKRSQALPLELTDDPLVDPGYGDLVSRTLDVGLASMPVGQREVVVGRLLRGRSFAELARDLGTSEEACRMRFMRGLQHLRDEFEKEGLGP